MTPAHTRQQTLRSQRSAARLGIAFVMTVVNVWFPRVRTSSGLVDHGVFMAAMAIPIVVAVGCRRWDAGIARGWALVLSVPASVVGVLLAVVAALQLFTFGATAPCDVLREAPYHATEIQALRCDYEGALGAFSVDVVQEWRLVPGLHVERILEHAPAASEVHAMGVAAGQLRVEIRHDGGWTESLWIPLSRWVWV